MSGEGGAEEFIPETLKVTSLDYYLVIARYNRATWNHLGTVPWGAGGETLQDAAHEKAEEAIPEASSPGGAKPLNFITGVVNAWSFDTPLHSSLRDVFIQYARAQGVPPGTSVTISDAQSAVLVEEQLQGRANNPADPGIGWVALVRGNRINDFFLHLGGRYGPLVQMYDLEVIPLNDDQNTDDLYQFMTPVNWRK
jgi:hypothetical protein